MHMHTTLHPLGITRIVRHPDAMCAWTDMDMCVCNTTWTLPPLRVVVLSSRVPVAMLLMQRNATVTIVHSRTVSPEKVVREADIVVVAVGSVRVVATLNAHLEPRTLVRLVRLIAKPCSRAGRLCLSQSP